MDDEHRFSTVLHRAVATLEPPTERLVSGGLARGRRRRRRVLCAEIATGLAVTAAVAGVVVAVIPGQTPHRVGSNAGAQSPTISRPMSAMTPQLLLQTALDTLPRPGKTSKYAGNSEPGSVAAFFVYDDGHGAAAIDVSLTYPVAGLGPKQRAPIIPCTAQIDGCAVLSDGSHALSRKGHQYTDGRQPNATEWSIDLVRPDGVQVSFIEWNAPQPKGAAISRSRPPFTIDELTAWADRPAWQTRVTAARAKAAEHLFTPQQIKAVIPNESASAGMSITEMRKNCQYAKSLHKGLPPYCAKLP
jgi:hypothetical protein